MCSRVAYSGGAAPRGPLIGLASALLVACGSSGDAPDFDVHGAGVVVRTQAAFAHQSDLPERVEGTVQAALDYWGGSWDDLRGRVIVLEGTPYVSCRGAAGAVGCYDGQIRVSTLDAGRTMPCVEATVLVHEVGHAVLGDRDHRDARWMDFAAVARALAGRRGYRGREVVACDLVPNVWRHPPARGP